MNKLDKLNKLVYEHQCKLADAEASGKGFKEVSKLLNDTIEKRKNYITELAERNEPMAVIERFNFNTSDYWTEFHCPKCNKVVSIGDKFCSECGQKLGLEKENE